MHTLAWQYLPPENYTILGGDKGKHHFLRRWDARLVSAAPKDPVTALDGQHQA